MGSPSDRISGVVLERPGGRDTARLVWERRTIGLSDRLHRALGSISANLAGGYSRGTDGDRARFYEYARGSARESRDWYLHVTSRAKPSSGIACN